MIEPAHATISTRRQCVLLGLNRSSFYYQPKHSSATVRLQNPVPETPENLHYMSQIDQLYLKCPFYGSRRMTAVLQREGYPINRKRIQRLMRLMGIQAIYPKPRRSRGGQGHQIYPYLLNNVAIERADHVWCTDITWLPLPHGFVYLVAIMDWFSRYVLSWRLSNTLDTAFCLEALDAALEKCQPEIFNSDQGCQFTSKDFTDRLKVAEIKISMDGRGRFLDNIFIERLWRSLKYEDIYIKDYRNVPELSAGIDSWFQLYNHHRPHQALEYKTPAMLYHGCQYQRTA